MLLGPGEGILHQGVVHTPEEVVHTPEEVVHTPEEVARIPGEVVRTPEEVVHTPADANNIITQPHTHKAHMRTAFHARITERALCGTRSERCRVIYLGRLSVPLGRLSVTLGRLSVALRLLLLRITASVTGIGHGGPSIVKGGGSWGRNHDNQHRNLLIVVHLRCKMATKTELTGGRKRKGFLGQDAPLGYVPGLGRG